jgi:hypothetical protein
VFLEQVAVAAQVKLALQEQQLLTATVATAFQVLLLVQAFFVVAVAAAAEQTT